MSLAVIALSLGQTACGGGGKDTSSAVSDASKTQVNSGVAPGTTLSAAQEQRRFRGDEDDDDGVGADEYTGRVPGDSDADFDNDKKDKELGYHDSDDSGLLKYGHAAGGAEGRLLRGLVTRYYAAATAGDGATACAMIEPSLVKTIPQDYGSGGGPSYLRGSKTCAGVMSLLFKHEHGQLSAAVKVTGVRVDGNRALALVGSSTLLASSMTLERKAGVWKVVGLLGSPLS